MSECHLRKAQRDCPSPRLPTPCPMTPNVLPANAELQLGGELNPDKRLPSGVPTSRSSPVASRAARVATRSPDRRLLQRFAFREERTVNARPSIRQSRSAWISTGREHTSSSSSPRSWPLRVEMRTVAIHLPASVLSIRGSRTRHVQLKIVKAVRDFRVTTGQLVVKPDRQIRPRASVLFIRHRRSLRMGSPLADACQPTLTR